MLHQHELPQLVLFWKVDSHNSIFPKITPNTIKCDTIRIHSSHNFHLDHLLYRKHFSESLCSGKFVTTVSCLHRTPTKANNKAGTGKTQNVLFTVSLRKTLYRTESLHPPGHSLTAAVIGSVINNTVYIIDLLSLL